jgi:pimeloyl-ACP methyl ester carboxylesterase
MNTLRIDGLDAYLRYHDLPGAEPTLVFLHGLGSASSSCFPRIARDACLVSHRALLVDLLGFGFSDRPSEFSYTMESHAKTVASMLDRLRVKQCVVIGHSMGGSIAILLAASREDLVGNLIVAEANLDPGPGVASGAIASMAEAEFAVDGHRAFIRQLLHAGFGDYAGTVQAADPIALHRSAVSLIANRTPTYRELLNAASIPRTYIFSDESRSDPDVQRLPVEGITIRIVENAGHDMMGDNPE